MRVTWVWAVAVLAQGCATSKATRTGATVSVQTANAGTSEGELFAVDEAHLWLCDGRREVAALERAAVVGASISAVGTEAAPTTSLAVGDWPTWARWARHPEGPPKATGRCVLSHQDSPPTVVELTLNARDHVTGVLLEATRERLVLRLGEGPACFDPSQLVGARLLVREEVRAERTPSGLPLAYFSPEAILIAGAALVFKEMTSSPDERLKYVPIDLSQVTALRALAKYPAGAPTDLCPR